MRVTESLIHQNNRNRLKKQSRQDDFDENEPTQAYKEEKMEWWSINRNRSSFAASFDDGINHQASVFDRKAVFHTGER